MDALGGKKYSDLPVEARSFLGDFDAVTFVSGLVQKYAGPEHAKKVSDVIALVRNVATGSIGVGDLPSKLGELFAIDKEAARSFSSDLAIHRLLPVSEMIGLDVESTLREWGADPTVLNGITRIKSEAAHEAPVESSVQRALTDTGAVFSDPVLQHRLELIVASYRDGVRTREQAVAVLMRPVKTGGLEMGEQAAGDVLELVASELGEPNRLPDATKVAGNTLPDGISAGKVPGNDEGGAKADEFTKADEEEIKQIAETKRAVIEQPTLITDTKAAAEKIAADAKLSFATGELKTRFEHIIDARLRDVRDGFETRAKLEAATDQGGVGLAGAQLVAVMEMVEEMDAMHHKALAIEMAGKKEAHVAQKAQRAQEAEGVAAQEAQVMAKRYAEITGKAPTELVAPTPSRPTSVPTAQAVEQREQQIDTAKVRSAIEAAKAPEPAVRPVLSEASIPTAPSGRPKVEDIRFERKLAGPIEELRLLTLTDFRRLSKEAKQSTQKIHDKVELVSQEGYDRRIAAVRAWRESPLSQMYVALSREALIAGKGIAQILAEKRAAGEDVPTDVELGAIVELNGILRF